MPNKYKLVNEIANETLKGLLFIFAHFKDNDDEIEVELENKKKEE